jgi:hypothetical protein
MRSSMILDEIVVERLDSASRFLTGTAVEAW